MIVYGMSNINYTLCLKKGYLPTTNDDFNNSCLSKYAIEKWFDMPPHLFNVRTLPWQTLKP